MRLFRFLSEFRFSDIFCRKTHFWDSSENEEKIGGNLIAFVLLNTGVPNVETIYFVLIEQKKYNCLQKLPGLLVSKKDEVISSSKK